MTPDQPSPPKPKAPKAAAPPADPKATAKPKATANSKPKAKANTVRLNKWLADTGHCSRRKADELIAAGRVKINGKLVTELGTQLPANPAAKLEVTVDGQLILPPKTKKQYYLFNKPKDTLTTRADEAERKELGQKLRKTIYSWLPNHLHTLNPVGRLDRNTTGLLLLTDDGELLYRLTHPSYHVPKVYQVQVERTLDQPKALAQQLLDGIWLEPEHVLAQVAEVTLLNAKSFGLTLMTGYNRQIRRSMEALGYEVVALKRLSMGPLLVQGLSPGHYRPLSFTELGALKKAVGLK